eukprot:126729-Rhodomonas_salina.2
MPAEAAEKHEDGFRCSGEPQRQHADHAFHFYHAAGVPGYPVGIPRHRNTSRAVGSVAGVRGLCRGAMSQPESKTPRLTLRLNLRKSCKVRSKTLLFGLFYGESLGKETRSIHRFDFKTRNKLPNKF